MGSYGIGPARIAAAAVEQNHDEHGIIWPKSIAPFSVIILPLNIKNEKIRNFAEFFYENFSKKNIDVIIDDRVERAGVKFKDADLIGIPIHVIISERGLKDGKIEIKIRKTGQKEIVDKNNLLEKVIDTMKNYSK